MSSTLTNKREVREYVKQALQACVDAHLLDVEDQKLLIKNIADAAEVPTNDGTVGALLYKSVLAHLTESEASDDTVSQVKSQLDSLRSPSPADGHTESTPEVGSSTTASNAAVNKTPALSLSGLRARLTKRREEMQKPASEAATVTENQAPSLSAPRDTSNVVASEADRVSLVDAVESYGPTAPATAEASPAMGPTLSVVSPPPMPHEDGDDDRTDAQSSHRDGEPPVKRERVEVVLTAAPIEEEDLYAGLPLQQQPRGRGFGGYRGRGRGRGYGPSPYAPPPFGADVPVYGGPHDGAPYRGGGGGAGYRGRGGPYAGPPAPYYGHPVPFRGGYAPY